MSDTTTTDTEISVERALAFADPMVLRGLLYLLTGDDRLRDMTIGAAPGLFAGEMAALTDEADIALLHELALAVVNGSGGGPAAPPEERIDTAIELTVGARIDGRDRGFWREELALEPWARGVSIDARNERTREDFHVVVIGAGLAGINAAAQLGHAGIAYTVLDKNEGVGGTWQQNTYPGARVDVPSRVYSHTWAVDYPFSHLCAPQAENEAYINWCADEHDVRSNLRLGVEVTELAWDDGAQRWSVKARTADGRSETLSADVVISAVGFMDRPRVPQIEGLEDFDGPVFHTARWDHSVELAGRRVAVIGTGASGCQLVPGLAEVAGHVTVFQRSAPWFLEIPGYRHPLPPEMLWLDRNIPLYTNFFRLRTAWATADHNFRPVLYRDPEWHGELSISEGNQAALDAMSAYIAEQVGDDAELLAKVTPTYPPFAKRFVVDNGWFEALKRDDVELVTSGIERVEPDAIVTVGGEHHPCDVIVLATGFRANDYLWPMTVVGRDGLTLEERWSLDGARAYNGVTVPGFPNLFMLYGPNTNAFANGPVVWGELQTRYALEWIKLMVERGIAAADVKEAAYDEFNERLDERLRTAVWLDPRQRSYYTNDKGRVATNAPWSTEEYWHFIRRPDLDDYEIS